MALSLSLLIVATVLVIAGAYLLLERSLTRILVGVLLMSNGVNVLFIAVSGPAKSAPIIGRYEPDAMTDPLPMAMALTAIVITLGTLAYLLTVAYRSFQLHGHDEVQDDVEDAQIRRLAELDVESESYDDSGTGSPDEHEGEDDEEALKVPVDELEEVGEHTESTTGGGAS